MSRIMCSRLRVTAFGNNILIQPIPPFKLTFSRIAFQMWVLCWIYSLSIFFTLWLYLIFLDWAL